MIKLNNKNITYVALADSNNSIKAPKEIWYADSNNSVKLVYRRKDALIEGEDYERYHWLVSNSEDSKTPYINTLIPPDLNQNIAFSFKVINSTTNGGEPGVYGALLPTSWRDCVIRCYKNISYNYIILEYNNDNADFPQRENMIIKTEFSEGKEYDCSLSINSSTAALGVINNESKELVTNSNVNFVLNPQPTHKLFVETKDTSWSFKSVGFKKFNITNIISLVPCKLLKPVPKWLDANGIRRNIGECGMIDLVSGKFYGNVNSVGTFTVENYYERKEWLQGDGTAYIDTDIIVDVPSLRYSLKFVRDTNNVEFLCGSRNSNVQDSYSSVVLIDNVHNDMIRLDAISTSILYYANIISNVPNEVHINCQTNSAIVNDSGITGNRIEFNNSPYTFRIFDVYPKNNSMFHNTCTCKMSYFNLDDGTHSLNLIPCTLTMDLPASMDANNIARTKGTSGMWDLVSDRFYGNVANSGTFKAVNLAEGVDYEVHQWIVRTGGAYISIPINLWQNRFDMCIEAIKNYSYFNTYSETNPNGRCFITYNAGENNPYILIAFREGGVSHISDLKFSQALSSNTISIFQKDGIATGIINGVEYQAAELVESSWNYDIECSVPLGKTQYFKVYNRDGTYRSNLIPVKLLRSIPSKYDANGIARQVGECGMYDTVNDKFYGNVASSGSFTVSDDN